MTRLRLFPAAALIAALSPALPAQGTNMSLVAHIPFTPCTTGDVWYRDGYMLVARRSQGFSILDVSNPASPVVANIHPPGYPKGINSYGVGDIKSDGRYIYATNESTGGGVYIYDTAPNPMAPVLTHHLQHTRINAGVHNCWIEGNHLYCVSNGTSRIEVFDVSNKTSPVHLATLGNGVTSASAHDVIVLDNRAYCSLWGSIAIYDVTNPASPVLLASKSYSGAANHNMWPSEDRKHLYTTDENILGGVGGALRIWDIQNLPTITQVGQFKMGVTSSIVHNVHVHGDMLWVSYYKEGVRIASLRSDPTNPIEIASYDTFNGTPCFFSPNYAGCWGVYPFERDYVFVSDLDTGAWIFRFKPVHSSFTTPSLTVTAGQNVDLILDLQNTTLTELVGLAAIVVTKINTLPLFTPVLIAAPILQGAEKKSFAYQLAVPPGLPPGLTVEFLGVSGTFDPLTAGDQKTITITLQ